MFQGRTLVMMLLLLAPLAMGWGASGSAQTASSPAPKEDKANPSKPDAAQERLADELTAYAILKLTFKKEVQAFAIERFAAYEEPVDQKFARCLVIAYPGSLKEDFFKDLVKSQLSSEAAILKELTKDTRYAEAMVKSRELALEAAKKGDLFKAEDVLEIDYNNRLKEEDAAVIVRLTALVESLKTPEVTEARKQMKERVREVLAKNPDLLKQLTDVPKPSDELRKSRDRAKELIEKAKKK